MIKNSIYFIGAGGVSMSSLAMIAKQNGFSVGGSDKNISVVTQKLIDNGITVYHGHKAENVEEYSTVVYTAAIGDDNPELIHAHELGLNCIKRSEFLGNLMKSYNARIGVCGMHGKSTTTSMLGHIYLNAGLNPTIVNGAEMTEINSAYHIGEKTHFIFEACEYKDSFLSMYPTTAVVLNIEMDHPDYFHSLEQIIESFICYMNIAGTAVVNGDDNNIKAALESFKGKAVTYGISSEKVDYRAVNLNFVNGFGQFDIDGLCSAVKLKVNGEHNVYNALAAAAAAHVNGVSAKAIAEGLSTFSGLRRRFEFKGSFNGVDVYDDYAHHPSEIKATLSSAKKLGYNHIWCLFQPHTYSRTAELFNDFTQAFNDADMVVLTDIYSAREVNTYGVTSEQLASQIHNAVCFPTFEAVADYVRINSQIGDLVITMGAGEMYKSGDLLLK